MAKFCGGIKLNNKFLKVIKGVICAAEDTEDTIDVNNTVSTCGQLWDRGLFTVSNKVITIIGDDEGNPVGGVPIFPIKTNCGINLDGRLFKITKDGVSEKQDAYRLFLVPTPSDATVKLTDANGAELTFNIVDYITGSSDTYAFLLGEIGTEYTLTVSKTGYVTQTKTITQKAENQTLRITLEAEAG
jgi:hypothetical protein